MISPTVLAYTADAIHTSEAIALYTAWTERGEKPPLYQLDRQTNIDLADLMVAHAIASREPYPLLEGLWIEGLADISLRRILIECLEWNHDTFLRKRPLFARIYRLCQVAYLRNSKRYYGKI